MAVVLLFSAISAWAYLPWWERAFRSDGSPLSWLSSALLFSTSVIVARQGIERRLSGLLAGWLSLALLALAMDEQFMFHEYWKFHCAEWTAMCTRPTAGHIDWLANLPMVLVGGIGLIAFATLVKQTTNTAVRTLLTASVAIGVVLALGIHFGRALNLLPASITLFEELFEVLAEALFLCAMIEIPGQPASPSDHVQSASSR